METSLSSILIIVTTALAIVLVVSGVKVVPQSKVFVVERFGKYRVTLDPGLNVIVPLLDHVSHRVDILERQLDEFDISVIARDNVEVVLETTVFYRIIDAARSVYRIQDVDKALKTAAESIVRSAAGKLELDELQSSRDTMNEEIARNLRTAAEVWGLDITRTEITDVRVDDATKEAQRQQLNAERARRAAIATAEGEKRSQELAAEAELYTAEKKAEAIKVTADAEAYSIQKTASAEAEQTRLIASAIQQNGAPAIQYEILKRQVDAIGQLSSSSSTKSLIVPSDIVGVLGSIETILKAPLERDRKKI